MSGRNISGLYYLKFLKQIGLEYQLTHTDPPNPPRTQWTYFSTLWGSTPYNPNIFWNLMAPTKLWPLTTYPSSTQTHQTHPIWPFLHFMTFFTVQTISFIKPHNAQYPLTHYMSPSESGPVAQRLLSLDLEILTSVPNKALPHESKSCDVHTDEHIPLNGLFTVCRFDQDTLLDSTLTSLRRKCLQLFCSFLTQSNKYMISIYKNEKI